jgi:hypothetical protein
MVKSRRVTTSLHMIIIHLAYHTPSGILYQPQRMGGDDERGTTGGMIGRGN